MTTQHPTPHRQSVYVKQPDKLITHATDEQTLPLRRTYSTAETCSCGAALYPTGLSLKLLEAIFLPQRRAATAVHNRELVVC